MAANDLINSLSKSFVIIMDDSTPLNRTDRILRNLIWIGLGTFALLVIDILYLDSTLVDALFND